MLIILALILHSEYAAKVLYAKARTLAHKAQGFNSTLMYVTGRPLFFHLSQSDNS